MSLVPKSRAARVTLSVLLLALIVVAAFELSGAGPEVGPPDPREAGGHTEVASAEEPTPASLTTSTLTDSSLAVLEDADLRRELLWLSQVDFAKDGEEALRRARSLVRKYASVGSVPLVAISSAVETDASGAGFVIARELGAIWPAIDRATKLRLLRVLDNAPAGSGLDLAVGEWVREEQDPSIRQLVLVAVERLRAKTK